MNLLDIQTKEWNRDLLAAAGEGLSEKLGSPLSPNTVVGQVSEYMQERSVEKLVIVKHSSLYTECALTLLQSPFILLAHIYAFVFHGQKKYCVTS